MVDEKCDKCQNLAIGKYDRSNVSHEQIYFCDKHRPKNTIGMKSGDEREVEEKVIYCYRLF